MNIPECMKIELGAWNNGEGVDIETWIACTGNFSLAVGYASIFCPEFKEFEGYIFRYEGCEFSEEDISSVRNWEAQEGITPKSIECVLNHIHISDLQYSGCDDLTIDKVLVLGEKLKAIYEARLAYVFPFSSDRALLGESQGAQQLLKQGYQDEGLKLLQGA